MFEDIWFSQSLMKLCMDIWFLQSLMKLCITSSNTCIVYFFSDQITWSIIKKMRERQERSLANQGRLKRGGEKVHEILSLFTLVLVHSHLVSFNLAHSDKNPSITFYYFAFSFLMMNHVVWSEMSRK